MNEYDACIFRGEIDEVAASLNLCYPQFDAAGKAAALRLAGSLGQLRQLLDRPPISLSAPETDTGTHAQTNAESIPARKL